MLAFAHLARFALRKGQQNGFLRFVILTGIAACRAGWSEVSARCRGLAIEVNPHHLVGKFDSLEDALRSEAFVPFVHHLDRFCTFERAEHLLEQLDPDWLSQDGPSEPGLLALELLDDREDPPATDS
jgi:hypothetical protein